MADHVKRSSLSRREMERQQLKKERDEKRNAQPVKRNKRATVISPRNPGVSLKTLLPLYRIMLASAVLGIIFAILGVWGGLTGTRSVPAFDLEKPFEEYSPWGKLTYVPNTIYENALVAVQTYQISNGNLINPGLTILNDAPSPQEAMQQLRSGKVSIGSYWSGYNVVDGRQRSIFMNLNFDAFKDGSSCVQTLQNIFNQPENLNIPGIVFKGGEFRSPTTNRRLDVKAENLDGILFHCHQPLREGGVLSLEFSDNHVFRNQRTNRRNETATMDRVYFNELKKLVAASRGEGPKVNLTYWVVDEMSRMIQSHPGGRNARFWFLQASTVLPENSTECKDFVSAFLDSKRGFAGSGSIVDVAQFSVSSSREFANAFDFTKDDAEKICATYNQLSIAFKDARAR